MKNKEYVKPEMNVYQMETPSILAGSVIEKAKEEDYNEDAVSNYRDPSGSIGLIKRSLTPPPAIDGCWEGVFGMLGYATLTGSYPERYPK